LIKSNFRPVRVGHECPVMAARRSSHGLAMSPLSPRIRPLFASERTWNVSRGESSPLPISFEKYQHLARNSLDLQHRHNLTVPLRQKEQKNGENCRGEYERPQAHPIAGAVFPLHAAFGFHLRYLILPDSPAPKATKLPPIPNTIAPWERCQSKSP